MPDCDSCYDPACARSLNALAPCNCTDFFNVVRLANNSYTNAVFNALPATAASITTGHLDALRGHSNVLQVVALTPAAVALYNGGAVLAAPHPQAGQAWYMAVDGTAFGDLGSMIEIFKNHEGEREPPLKPDWRTFLFQLPTRASDRSVGGLWRDVKNLRQCWRNPLGLSQLQQMNSTMLNIPLLVSIILLPRPLVRDPSPWPNQG